MAEEKYKIELVVKKGLWEGKTEYFVQSKGIDDKDETTWKPVANLDWKEVIEKSKAKNDESEDISSLENELQSILNKIKMKKSEIENRNIVNREKYAAKWYGWDREDFEDNAWKPVVAHLDFGRFTEEYSRICGMEEFDQMKRKIDRIMAEKIAVVGSLGMYKKIHEDFLEFQFDHFFVKEQFDLYSWREEFFFTNFPSYVRDDNNWYTDGGDDSHAFDTVPYNITQQFDRVLMLACIPKDPERKVWFDNDEELSNMAKSLYDSSFVEFNEGFFEKESLKKEGLGYSGAAHLLVAAFQTGPYKLEHLAMKTAIKHHILLDDLPTELKVKAVVGMFDGKEDIPDYISDHGREALQYLRVEYGFIDEN